MYKHALKLNLIKCAFGVLAGNFLGFLAQKRATKIDANKAKAILVAQPLRNKKELQSFLGQVNYLRRFISNAAGKIKVFSSLFMLRNKWALYGKKNNKRHSKYSRNTCQSPWY